MSKSFAIRLAALAALSLTFGGNAQLAANRAGTNVVYYSEVHTAPARIKERINERHDASGYKLMDRKGVFARPADLIAEQVTVEGAHRIAAAWRQGFSNGVEELRAALNNAPTSGMYLGVEIPYDPESSRDAIDMYVASNHFDAVSGIDMFWIHFNHPTPKPTMEIPYCWTGGVKRVAASWSMPGTAANWTNVYRVVKGDYIYDNCHLLFAQRPAELSGGAIMNLRPYGNFGNPETGISWGKIQTTWQGRSSITGTLTDGTNDWEFVNGHLMSIKPKEEE